MTQLIFPLPKGWNQTEADWRFLIENPENICLLAERDKKVIGTTTAINYSNDVCWIGMVLVNKEYRGVGIAKLLLTNILKEVESCRSVKLDATQAGREVYQKLGFKNEYSIGRMTNPLVKDFVNPKYDALPEPVQIEHIDEIAALDEYVFGANRQKLITFLIKQYPNKGWLLKRDGKITAFVLGREGRKYHHIGPLVARSTVDAKILVSKALSNLKNQPVVMDVLPDKEDLVKCLTDLGFTQERNFVRMYKDENIFAGQTDKQYLIGGPEFG